MIISSQQQKSRDANRKNDKIILQLNKMFLVDLLQTASV